MRYVFVFVLSVISFSVHSQYWFGPKIGISNITHNYQRSTYRDSFDIPSDWNFQAGLAVSYTATDRYAVYGELLFEKISKKVTDKATGGNIASSDMNNFFISVPVMLRITLGRVPFHYYINGGPRLAYWVGGNGVLNTEENDEFGEVDENGNILPIEYSITFNESKVLDVDDQSVAYVSKPNRMQFGLTAGAGMFLDIQGGGRLQFDVRYTWVHSNMGTNNGAVDIGFFDSSYRENFEHYHGIATVGVAYMFGYNSQLRRKGKSTSSKSNKKKK